jgi:hypothetical protein
MLLIMILLMIFPVNYAAPRIRSMSRNYRISFAPKYGCNFSGIAIEPSAR